MQGGLIVGAVVVGVFAANAAVAWKIRRLLARLAGLGEMNIARRGVVWRYQVASLAALAAGIIIYAVALIHAA